MTCPTVWVPVWQVKMSPIRAADPFNVSSSTLKCWTISTIPHSVASFSVTVSRTAGPEAGTRRAGGMRRGTASECANFGLTLRALKQLGSQRVVRTADFCCARGSHATHPFDFCAKNQLTTQTNAQAVARVLPRSSWRWNCWLAGLPPTDTSDEQLCHHCPCVESCACSAGDHIWSCFA